MNFSEKNKELSRLIRKRTENFFKVNRLCCSESIIFVINHGLKGGLPPEIAVNIGSGFCGGMGGGDGVCGALSGAVAALGIMLGPNQADGLSKKKIREAAKDLHAEFKKAYRETRCQDLIEPFQNDRKARKKNCAEITGMCAELVSQLILHHRPKLADTANIDFLRTEDSMVTSLFKKISRTF